jgi:F0F1-type ATP synthase assembly protein I
MDATSNFSLRFARPSESKVERNASLLDRRVLQRIATRMSLLSQAIGFSAFGILIIVNWHQTNLDGLAGGSAVAIVGGISAILVGTVFLVATCLHWRFCARHPATLPVRCQSARFSFARPNPITPMALLSA